MNYAAGENKLAKLSRLPDQHCRSLITSRNKTVSCLVSITVDRPWLCQLTYEKGLTPKGWHPSRPSAGPLPSDGLGCVSTDVYIHHWAFTWGWRLDETSIHECWCRCFLSPSSFTPFNSFLGGSSLPTGRGFWRVACLKPDDLLYLSQHRTLSASYKAGLMIYFVWMLLRVLDPLKATASSQPPAWFIGGCLIVSHVCPSLVNGMSICGIRTFSTIYFAVLGCT